MVRRLHVQRYENFLKYVDELGNAESVYILYTGTKLPETGESWCPDCVEAYPFIEQGFNAASEETQLVIVEVGDRALVVEGCDEEGREASISGFRFVRGLAN
ncbi:thioredoxin domain-containing protein 17-like isoform X2 [Nylanderia fulva]|uniref:thioredoxin domain-containing protein 17-like isoform X2 n=1 Tax=Nylanderia fulva TaxID=613905 RepID=UPI0010FB9A6E|nr:thioredoxin domain-containing protein 17-like isoform X2 [Nylanderia fulva]